MFSETLLDPGYLSVHWTPKRQTCRPWKRGAQRRSAVLGGLALVNTLGTVPERASVLGPALEAEEYHPFLGQYNQNVGEMNPTDFVIPRTCRCSGADALSSRFTAIAKLRLHEMY